MIPSSKNQLKKHPAKFGLLEYGDLIEEGDEYYNPFSDLWCPVEFEFIGQCWESDLSKPVRRKFEEDEEK